MSCKTTVALIGLSLLGLAACEQKGPLERAGEKVDHAADTIKNGGEEPMRDKLQDEADKAREKANDAAERATDHK
jgi:hyperosmotically inducible protein